MRWDGGAAAHTVSLRIAFESACTRVAAAAPHGTVRYVPLCTHALREWASGLHRRLHILGGLADQLNRELFPFHAVFLGYEGAADVPGPVAALVLALLHAVGFGLIGAGIGMLALLAVVRRTGDRRLALVVGALAACGEGSVGVHMLWLGFAFGWIPLGAAALVLVGVLLLVAAP